MKRAACFGLIVLPFIIGIQNPGQDAARQRLREYLEARKAWEEHGLTSSLADSYPDIPFLDGYAPDRFAPLAEMPRSGGRGYLLAVPGGYEMDAAAFCLNAGTYRPSRGEGYLAAPLSGRAAPLVSKVLTGWADHPEISHREVQRLLWALDDRVEPGRLPPQSLNTARKLLGERGLEEAAAVARGPEPPMPDIGDPALKAELDKAGAALGGLAVDDEAQREMETALKALESLAARMEKGERVDPAKMAAAMERLAKAQEKAMKPVAEAAERFEDAARRFEATLLDPDALYEDVERAAVLDGDPEPPEGSRDIPPGRWSLHPGGYFLRTIPEDHTRTRLEIHLPQAHTIERDGRGRLSAVTGGDSRLTIAYDDSVKPLPVPGDPGLAGLSLQAHALGEIRMTGAAAPLRIASGWTFAGTPAGNGRPADAGPGITGVRDRYEKAVGRRDEFRRLGVNTAADVADLAHLAAALEPAASRSREGADALRLVREAWQAAVIRGTAEATSSEGQPDSGGPRAMAAAGPKGGLPDFDPGKNGIHPGNTARQRLGSAPVQDPLSEGKKAFLVAMAGCEFIQGILDVFNGFTDPITFIMEKFGFGAGGMPGMMLGELIQMIFDVGAEISKALGGDPPRPDFRVFTLPLAPELPLLEPRDGLSKARADAGNAAARELLGMFTALRAAQIAGDRLGGAMEAGDEEWARRQAEAYVHYKRLAGERMIAAALGYESLMDVLEAEGEEDRSVSSAEITAHLQALKSSGLRPASLEAARSLGLGDAEIKAVLERRLAIDPDDFPEDGLLSAGRNLAAGLRALGEIWIRLPLVPGKAALPEAGPPAGVRR